MTVGTAATAAAPHMRRSQASGCWRRRLRGRKEWPKVKISCRWY